MYRCFLCLLCCCSFVTVFAQQYKANWEQVAKFDRLVNNFNNNLSIYPYFINGTDCFWYRMRTDDGVAFYLVDPAKKSHEELFDMSRMLSQLAQFTHKAYTSVALEFIDLNFSEDGKSFIFSIDDATFEYDMKSGRLEKLHQSLNKRVLTPSGHCLSPDSCYYIYAYKHNLYCYGNKDKGVDTTVVQLTTDGEPFCSYARNPQESQMQKTYPAGCWLGDSRTFLIAVCDERQVDNMHLVNMLKQPRPELVTYRYNCPGDVVIGQYFFKILDVKTKKLKEIRAEKWKDQYMTFSHDDTKNSSEFFFYRTKRTWDEKELCAYNLESGKVRVVFNEIDKPYFDYVVAQTHYLNGAKEILYRSERTGWGHFYLYDGQTGKLKRAITEGEYLVGQIIRIDTIKRDVYLYAHGREKNIDPYYYVAYRVNLDKPEMQLLTPENATHSVFISPSCKYIIDSYSRVDLPPITVVRNCRGREIMRLEAPDIDNIVRNGWCFPKRFCVKAADGVTDLYGVMWKPMDFDSTRKYPIISEVYPGPQYENVPTSFELEYSKATRLAQLGFIVIQVGHRGGSPLRGKAYHRYGYGKLRDYALADDQAVIKELSRRYPFIDIDNVGIFGHSGGGFMSVAATCSSNFYKAAVATAGNHDNRIFNRGWVELNNGVKEIKVNGSADSVIFEPLPIHTNIELASKCEGHLLLVTGMMDNNVHPAHTFRMARALMDAGINFDMLALPASKHGLVGSENDYFLFKMRNHFAKYLLGDFSGERFMNFRQSSY